MTFPGRFKDKVGVITGAAQGIGRAVALRFLAEGGRAVLVDRSDLVRQVAAEAQGEARAVVADLETWEGASAAVAAASEYFGRLDVLVNNVGGAIWMQPFEAFSPEQITAEIRRSLFPTLWCCRAALPVMEKGAVIVNVSSIATRGINRIPYSAAKGGVNALTASLALEAAGRGIRVVAAAPGGTDAPTRRVPRKPEAPSEAERGHISAVVEQTLGSSPMHRYGTLEEMAAPILFLASDEASYITGSVLPVGGGDLG
ncbi:benzoate diol dehydrogenase BenD [Azorhizobium doebereinerae]|uniref:benzoate diol dehydrogenase BenD n=1 Tax=Azorhizobium doebereinerae TaxID=281091 RepID=UPI00042A8E76|nr:benzoate diol dehydrogenase BenD [Azorhizobium doebereinerae]